MDELYDVTVDEVLAATDFSNPRYTPFEEVVKAYREAEAALQTAEEEEKEKSQAEVVKNAAKAELEQKKNERQQAEYAFYEALYVVQD